MSSPNENVAVFDVCNTLYRVNTTAEFIRFLHQENGSRLRTLTLAFLRSRRLPIRYVLILLGRLTNLDVLRNLIILTIRGIPQTIINDTACRFVDEALPSQSIIEVHHILEECRGRDMKIFLASSSLDVVVGAIAKKLNTDYVASILAYDSGRATGFLSKDITGRKTEALHAQHNLDPSCVELVCTDNSSDATLLSQASRKIVVASRGKVPPTLAKEGSEFVYVE